MCVTRAHVILRADFVCFSPFQSPTRLPRMSLPQRRFEVVQLRCVCIFAPHLFCVAKNPRLIACAAWNFLPALPHHEHRTCPRTCPLTNSHRSLLMIL
jgi:hypothetical protein